MTKGDEVSRGGSRVIHHAATKPAVGVHPSDGETLLAIEQHLRAFVGEPANVLHELVSEDVHLDVHILAPSQDDDCYTLVTTGMSDLAMKAPPGAEDYRYAELLLSLPSNWTPGYLWEADFNDESIYWPIRLLKQLALLPHMYQTWLAYGHTIPNGDPPMPYAEDTALCCALIMPPITLPAEFSRLTVRPEKTINFYGVIPLHESEMRFKLANGADALIQRLFEASVTEILDAERLPCV